MINFILLLLVTISWDANTEVDLAGYRVYYGQSPRNYTDVVGVGLDTAYNLDTLNLSGQWFFAVTAYDSANNESNYSSEVSWFFGDSIKIWSVNFFGDANPEPRGFMIYGDSAGFNFNIIDDFVSYDLSFDLQLTGAGYCIDSSKVVMMNQDSLEAETITKNIVKVNMTARQIRFLFNDDCWEPIAQSDANIRVDNICISRRGKEPMPVEFLKWR